MLFRLVSVFLVLVLYRNPPTDFRTADTAETRPIIALPTAAARPTMGLVNDKEDKAGHRGKKALQNCIHPNVQPKNRFPPRPVREESKLMCLHNLLNGFLRVGVPRGPVGLLN